MSEPTAVACSDGSATAGEQLAGTSPHAPAWVALEQPGPWGAKAFTASHLDRDLGRRIEEVAAEHAVRPSLIRCPGRHADLPDAGPATRTVLVAHTRPGATWLLEGVLADPAELLDLDWAALADGDREAVRRSIRSLTPSQRPHLLVCTNAKRDVCCAVKGRPLALAAAAERPGQVWEVTHTSGHRFAPTAVLLPAGTLHGRLDAASAAELLRAAERGLTVLEGSRGRSTWPGPAQAAELAVREQAGVLSLDALTVASHADAGERRWVTSLRHEDGRSWRVVTESRASGLVRAESCGKALQPMEFLTHVVEQTPHA